MDFESIEINYGPVSTYLISSVFLQHRQGRYLLSGFGVSNVGLPGMMPFSRARTALISPEIPAAGSEWPILLLIWQPSVGHVPMPLINMSISGDIPTQRG